MEAGFEHVQLSLDFSGRLFGLLREAGVQLSTQQTIGCIRAVGLLQTVEYDKLLSIYRITLINRRDDFPRLARVYAALLDLYRTDGIADEPKGELSSRQELTVKRQVFTGLSGADEAQEESGRLEGYSTHEVDHQRDFRQIQEVEFAAVLRELEKIARKYAVITRRKTKRSQRGRRVDFRASVRDCVKFDGEILRWRFKRKIPSHTRLVMLVDVSGSMEIYSTFFLNFLFSLHRNSRFKIEVFVFSTYLQHLTEYFRVKRFIALRESLAEHFRGWSGGTKIGQAIATLNQVHAATVTGKTSVVIMSDGWDTGEMTLLANAMSTLANRAKSVIWINPLKGDDNYQPLALGMATARPYCDEFLSSHNLASFETLASVLAR